MQRIFTGMLLVFLDFNLDFGASRLGLLPDFLGYIFMLRGLRELDGFSPQFGRITLYVRGMAVYWAVCYALDLFGLSSALGVIFTFVLGLVSTLFSLYISYTIIRGIIEIEEGRLQDLSAAKLLSVWKIWAVLALLTYALLFLPGLAMAAILGSFIAGIYYLYVFNQTKNLFYRYNSDV